MQARPPQAVRSIYLEACGQDRVVVTQYSEPPQEKGQALMDVQTKNYNYTDTYIYTVVKMIPPEDGEVHMTLFCYICPSCILINHVSKSKIIHIGYVKRQIISSQWQQGDFTGVN